MEVMGGPHSQISGVVSDGAASDRGAIEPSWARRGRGSQSVVIIRELASVANALAYGVIPDSGIPAAAIAARMLG